jgi:hypothetical protein
MKQKTLITITGTWFPSHSPNWIESASTWVPLIKEKGFDVLFLMPNPYLDKDYEIIGDFFFAKCPDGLENIYLRNHYYISKYFLNQNDYDYRYHTDCDTFIHSERFTDLIKEYTEITPKDYVGCVIPYPGLNPNVLNKLEIKEKNYYASGGSGFLLSKKAHEPLVNDFKKEDYNDDLSACDRITGSLLYQKGIKLWHDSRILFESPYRKIISDPYNLGTPFIGDKDSFLAVQHYFNGHMREILDNIQKSYEKNMIKIIKKENNRIDFLLDKEGKTNFKLFFNNKIVYETNLNIKLNIVYFISHECLKEECDLIIDDDYSITLNPNLDNWAISIEMFNWLKKNLPNGKTILEFGSGTGTIELVKHWNVYSVEQDKEWIGKSKSNYIYAPIKNGWYDDEIVFSKIPNNYDLIIIDGPKGSEHRFGIYDQLDKLNTNIPIIFDDTNREIDRKNAILLANKLGKKWEEIIGYQKNFIVIQ